MIANIYSSAAKGLETYVIDIEASMHSGIPQVNVVGLADQTVREAKDRIIAAFQNNGIKLPNKRFVVCLNPTDLRKQGSHLDLPLSLALLKSSGLLQGAPDGLGALGAMSLSGEIAETEQTFSLIEALVQHGCKPILIPESCIKAKRFFPNAQLIPIRNLNDVLDLYAKPIGLASVGKSSIRDQALNSNGTSEVSTTPLKPYEAFPHLDYSQVQGQERAKRAILIALAGHHHLLLYGPPGTGKTMLASRIPTVQMPLVDGFVYERLKLLSCAGHRVDSNVTSLIAPYRAPHAGVSLSSMLGGMQAHMLGEVTLAHRGVLFLDEMPEFKRDVLEGLRGPIEYGTVQLSKTGYKAEVPSSFILVATANPCPCGYHGFSDRCNCNDRDIQRYFSKLSGPMLDRFDLKVEVAFSKQGNSIEANVMPLMRGDTFSEGLDSKTMFEIIHQARLSQLKRYSSGKKFNGMLGPDEIMAFCHLSTEASKWISEHFKASSGEDSLRSQYKIIKLAQTIADIEGSDKIEKVHLIEAFYYNRRKLNR